MTYFIIEIVGVLASLLYIGFGLGVYGWWKGISIGSGFMPTVIGALMLLFSLLMLFSKLKKYRAGQRAEKLNVKMLLPFAAMLLILVANWLFGMLLACAVAAFLWLKFIEKYSYLKSAIATVILFAFVYGIFRLWLKVPFPTGILNITL